MSNDKMNVGISAKVSLKERKRIDRVIELMKGETVNDLDLSSSTEKISKKAKRIGKNSGSKKSKNEKGDLSLYIREILANDSRLWLDSPYISKCCKCLLYINKKGDFNYWRYDELLLRQEKVPFLDSSVGMKSQKLKQYFFEHEKAGVENRKSIDEFLKSRWSYNVFSFECGGGSSLSSVDSDPDGISEKNYRWPCTLSSGKVVYRENLIGLKDYCQWLPQNKDPGIRYYDTYDHEIRIPTLSTEIAIVLEKGIYDHTNEEDCPGDKPLRLHIGNLEGGFIVDRKVELPSNSQKNKGTGLEVRKILTPSETQNGDIKELLSSTYERDDEKMSYFLKESLSYVNKIRKKAKSIKHEQNVPIKPSPNENFLSDTINPKDPIDTGFPESIEDIPEDAYVFHFRMGPWRPGAKFSVEWRMPSKENLES